MWQMQATLKPQQPQYHWRIFKVLLLLQDDVGWTWIRIATPKKSSRNIVFSFERTSEFHTEVLQDTGTFCKSTSQIYEHHAANFRHRWQSTSVRVVKSLVHLAKAILNSKTWMKLGKVTKGWRTCLEYAAAKHFLGAWMERWPLVAEMSTRVTRV